MVERYEKTIEECLRKMVSTHQRDWDERFSIFLLDHRRDPCQYGVRAEASPALWSDVRGSPRQGTVDDRLCSRPCRTAARHPPLRPRSTWKWSVTGWRHATTSWPTRLVFKKATVCGCTALPGRGKGRPMWINVIYRIQRHPRAKMMVVHLDRLASYLVATRDA